jgi:cytoplasmic iron level regulating protein YaaA (DUF328/UPF0246 family)
MLRADSIEFGIPVFPATPRSGFMLFLLSPAKTLDYDTPLRTAHEPTMPSFLPRSAELIKLLKTQSVADIAALMHLSEPLSALNVERYAAWSPRFTDANSRPAALAFDGDVYDGLKAPTLNDADLAWAQDHLCILSGLYGVLRPLDRMQPYRLEMGTALPTARGATLYDYWGDTLAEHLNERLAADASPVIVNLASNEYFRAVRRKVLKARVVECVFEDWKNGQYKVISFFAKRARGLMARHAIKKKIATPKGLEKFNADGYRFDPAASQPDRLVFRRHLS